MATNKMPIQKIVADIRKSIGTWQEIPYVITIFNNDDQLVCDACRQIQGYHYNLDEVPELPYEECTCENGCRCWAYWATALGR